MSPLNLRRHRAERLLREQFEGLRSRVLANVRGRLRGSGVSLDEGDLEACYTAAWQGLYMAMLEGQEIANPAGWLTLVTFRRAIDEHRARIHARCGGEAWVDGAIHSLGADKRETETVCGREHDLAGELDDRVRLRQLFEGLRGRLDGREREAATLCYLQGLSRSQAAARMGVSDARMRKLMEGCGPGRPGVAGKVGALLETIRDGGWCEEQGSLMRAFAYGILDTDGERYRLALLHSSQCPACRAYVASLRGLAAVLPPVCLPWAVAAGALARAGDGARASGVAASGGTGAGLQAGRGIGGALSTSGAAGAGGAAGGGWLLGAGPLGGKLAVGCLLALGVGAGCVVLGGAAEHERLPVQGHPVAGGRATVSARAASAGDESSELPIARQGVASRSAGATIAAPSALTSPGRVSREFGFERASAPGRSLERSSLAPVARLAAATLSEDQSRGDPGSRPPAAPAAADPPPEASAGGVLKAEREFAPG